MPRHRFKPDQRVLLEDIVSACEQHIRSGAEETSVLFVRTVIWSFMRQNRRGPLSK